MANRAGIGIYMPGFSARAAREQCRGLKNQPAKKLYAVTTAADASCMAPEPQLDALITLKIHAHHARGESEAKIQATYVG